MELKDFQKRVDDWVMTNTPGYWRPNNMMLRLIEEVGELAREINHVYGEKPRKPTDENKRISDELGDVLFTIICIANALKIDLEQSFQNVMNKYETRDKNRHK